MFTTRAEVRAETAKTKLDMRKKKGMIGAYVTVALILLYVIFVLPVAFTDFQASKPADGFDLLWVVGVPALGFITIVWLLWPLTRSYKGK